MLHFPRVGRWVNGEKGRVMIAQRTTLLGETTVPLGEPQEKEQTERSTDSERRTGRRRRSPAERRRRAESAKRRRARRGDARHAHLLDRTSREYVMFVGLFTMPEPVVKVHQGLRFFESDTYSLAVECA